MFIKPEEIKVNWRQSFVITFSLTVLLGVFTLACWSTACYSFKTDVEFIMWLIYKDNSLISSVCSCFLSRKKILTSKYFCVKMHLFWSVTPMKTWFLSISHTMHLVKNKKLSRIKITFFSHTNIRRRKKKADLIPQKPKCQKPNMHVTILIYTHELTFTYILHVYKSKRELTRVCHH